MTRLNAKPRRADETRTKHTGCLKLSGGLGVIPLSPTFSQCYASHVLLAKAFTLTGFDANDDEISKSPSVTIAREGS